VKIKALKDREIIFKYSKKCKRHVWADTIISNHDGSLDNGGNISMEFIKGSIPLKYLGKI
jgi:hypothetical protein